MSEQTALQDLVVFAAKGVGYWADMARCVGGKDEEIDAFLDALRSRMGSCIRGENAQKAPASGRYHGFSVAY